MSVTHRNYDCDDDYFGGRTRDDLDDVHAGDAREYPRFKCRACGGPAMRAPLCTACRTRPGDPAVVPKPAGGARTPCAASPSSTGPRDG